MNCGAVRIFTGNVMVQSIQSKEEGQLLGLFSHRALTYCCEGRTYPLHIVLNMA